MKAKELYRILIVDDEQLIRKGIIHYIDWEQEGFLIAGEASNGQEALGLIETIHPHIIITDFVMPVMDGEEFTRIVKERYPHIEMIILSSFSDFEYVRATFQNGVVDYILKPQLDAQILLKGLKAAASRIPLLESEDKTADGHPSVEQMIDKLISGYDVSWNKEWLTSIFPFQNFYLLGLDINPLLSKEAIDLQRNIREKIDEEFHLNFSHGITYSFCPNKHLIVYLMNVNNDKVQDAIQFIGQMADLENGIGFVLTDGVPDFLQIGKAYHERLLKLLDYRFYLSEYPLLMNQNLPEQQPRFEKFNLERFTEELKHRHFDSAFEDLKVYVTRLSSCYTMDIYEYKAFFSNIIFNITILLSNMEYDTKDLETARYLYFKSFNEAATARQAVALLDSFMEEVKKSLDHPQNQHDHFNKKKLIDFMMEHYAEPLTLTGMAKHFHFNPSYLSNYFSTHMHEGFVEYLNKIRIEEATRLLMNGTISISEISSLVGFSDHSYFCKVFKKIKGLSPSQYKRKHS